MADSDSGERGDIAPDSDSDASAYADGYRRVMREMAWVRARGWAPTERQITVALMQAMKVYATARSGKFVSGQRPEWLHGRADALRALLRQDAGAPPEGV
jgi:hypothetical protein